MDYNKDSIGITFSILQKEYESEENRNKQLETKAQVLLAVSGVLSSALMLLLKSILELSQNKSIDILIVSVSLLFLLISMFLFLTVFKIQKFEQIKHVNLLSKKALSYDDYELKYHLSHDYLNCLEKNIVVGNLKVKRIKIGNYFIVGSIVFFAVVFANFTVGIISKERSEYVKKDNSTPAGVSKTPTSPPASDRTTIPGSSRPTHDSTLGNTSGKTPGIGTQPIERGHSGSKK